MLAVTYRSLEVVVEVVQHNNNKLVVNKKKLKKKKNLRPKKNLKIWIWVVSLTDLLIDYSKTLSFF